MGVPPPNEPPEKRTAQHESLRKAEAHEAFEDRSVRKATASLVLAILALASMVITAPLAMFAMLATYPSDGPSEMPWVTPLVFFSLPLLFAVPSLALAVPVVNRPPESSPDRPSAAAALCIAGLVVALALGPALDLLGNL
ncbi:hypothetical protein [Arthrobacter sp. OY3WO11]|uniref:hypothetical protein n=1 Tax=Arthrobacter sp. OY3WO11 TaxID=1835723 RepID=UPI0007CFE742|nr:hypothetical protein [Arthrobacter sp. OY3WO11]OAE03219.1 hypothetical protein A6A22_18690 [Arthrobacter sp. OY3WO11]